MCVNATAGFSLPVSDMLPGVTGNVTELNVRFASITRASHTCCLLGQLGCGNGTR